MAEKVADLQAQLDSLRQELLDVNDSWNDMSQGQETYKCLWERAKLELRRERKAHLNLRANVRSIVPQDDADLSQLDKTGQTPAQVEILQKMRAFSTKHSA